MNDITFTVVGNVVNDVELRFTKSGEAVASFRIAATARRFDRANDRWVDGDTAYFWVSCWRHLAHNVVQSVVKGMPVIVTGRLRSREVERPCRAGGQDSEHSHTTRYFDIEASSVGPDLSRGTATFQRVKREAVVESERRSLADAMAAAGITADELSAEEVDLETGEILAATA